MPNRQQWVATYPELRTRTNLLEFMEYNDGYATVIMQCITTLLEGPCYLRGYKLGSWCLDQVRDHNIERLAIARERCCKDIPIDQADRIYNESVGVIKNAWKNAAAAMGRHERMVFNEFDYQREVRVVHKHRNIPNHKMLQRFPNCVYCNCELTTLNFTVDHVIPLSKGGGRNGCLNRVLSCGKCNGEKGSNIWEPIYVENEIKSLPEFQATLRRVDELKRDRAKLKGGL